MSRDDWRMSADWNEYEPMPNQPRHRAVKPLAYGQAISCVTIILAALLVAAAVWMLLK